MNPAIDHVLTTARSQIGVHETGGNNHGPQVKVYLDSVGLPEGNPWCAAFVAWCMAHAGVKEWDATGDTWGIRDWAGQRHILHDTPAAGDVFLLLGSDGNPMHTGIVTSVDGSRVGTIEGNTGEPSDTDGDGVYAKSRAVGACQYVRWADLSANSVPPLRLELDGVTIDCHPSAVTGTTRVDLRAMASFFGYDIDASGLAEGVLKMVAPPPAS